jgi:hypothetical protein
MLTKFGDQVVDCPRRILLAHVELKAGVHFRRGRARVFGGSRGRGFRPGCCWRRTARQLRQPLAHGRNLRLVRRTIAAMRREKFLENVAGIEEGVDHLRTQSQFALANAVEQVLQDMRDLGQVGEPEGAGRALDRMRGAENRVELLGIGIVDVEAQQE